MKEVIYKYFIAGKEVSRENISWEYSTGISVKGDEVHVDYAIEDEGRIYRKSIEEVEDTDSSFTVEEGDALVTYSFDDDTNSWFVTGISKAPIEGFVDKQIGMLVELAERLKTKQENEGISEGIKPNSEGVKYNKHKAPLDIVQVRQFPKALQALALATAYGNKKYEATDKDFLNFKRVPGGSQTYFDAAARHNAERGDLDEESNLPHVIHAVWDMMAALELYIEENGINLKEFTKRYLEHLHMSK